MSATILVLNTGISSIELVFFAEHDGGGRMRERMLLGEADRRRDALDRCSLPCRTLLAIAEQEVP